MLACVLETYCDCISLEKDEAQVSFIKMRINGIWECPDADLEVGAKHVGETERFHTASCEPMPPLLANEAGEFGILTMNQWLRKLGMESLICMMKKPRIALL